MCGGSVSLAVSRAVNAVKLYEKKIGLNSADMTTSVFIISGMAIRIRSFLVLYFIIRIIR